jgi:hypothetical protein
MSIAHTIIVHDVADGLPPDTDDMVGRVAFIWNGAIVSGWPVRSGDPSRTFQGYWEPSEDALGSGRKFHGVDFWVELPVPGWMLGPGRG